MEGNGASTNVFEKANAECPACGANDWADPNDVASVVLPITDADGTIIEGGVLPALPLICLNCGFIRLHSLSVLRGEFK